MLDDVKRRDVTTVRDIQVFADLVNKRRDETNRHVSGVISERIV
jgi:hypothetical protein